MACQGVPEIELDDSYFERFSDTVPVTLRPYDPVVDDLVRRYVRGLRKWLGPEPEIEHRGATALHMLGKGEIDLYVRVDRAEFQAVYDRLQAALGEPGSLEPHRARFNDEIEGIEVEVQLVDRAHPEECAGRAFFRYLQAHPEAVEAYAAVKRKYASISRRAYYRAKYRFVRAILAEARAVDRDSAR
jgi:GrpB-like predicted nucleotidyltransferase (UPF0157 family)